MRCPQNVRFRTNKRRTETKNLATDNLEREREREGYRGACCYSNGAL